MQYLDNIFWEKLFELLMQIGPLGAVILISVLSISVCLFALFVVMRVVLEVKK